MAAQCTYPLASGAVPPQSPDPASWAGYSNHSCHAVGPHARVVDISDATHAQCAAACAAKGCLCYDMLEAVGGGLGVGGAGGTCRGTIDGVLRASPDRIVRAPAATAAAAAAAAAAIPALTRGHVLTRVGNPCACVCVCVCDGDGDGPPPKRPTPTAPCHRRHQGPRRGHDRPHPRRPGRRARSRSSTARCSTRRAEPRRKQSR